MAESRTPDDAAPSNSSSSQPSFLSAFNEGIAAFQIDTNRISLQTQFREASLSLTTVPDICGLAVDSQHLLVWTTNNDDDNDNNNNSEVQVFNINRGGVELYSHFALEDRAATKLALYQDTLFIAQGNDVHVADLDGTQRQSIHYENEVTHLHVASNFLVVATSKKDIHLLDISGREPTPVVEEPARIKAKGSIAALGCNADGTWVSIQVQKDGGAPSIYLYDTSSGPFSRRIAATPPGTDPVCHYWDPAEPKVMVCEYQSSLADTSIEEHNNNGGFVVLFVTDDGGVIVADTLSKENLPGTLLGIDTPRVYAAQTEYAATDNTTDILLVSSVMSSFHGFEDEGPSTLSALVQFAYFVALGDLEAAYISVQLVKKPSVWETLCKLCVKQRSLIMAEKCLSQMDHTDAIEAVNKARESDPNQEEVVLAAIAMELGATGEAENLLRECHRYDLLNDFLQSQERWDEALQVAEDHGSIDLKNTQYKYAKHLESIGSESLAVEYYMRSDQLKPYLERLVKSYRLHDAEDIVVKSKDPQLLSWLAQHFESISSVDAAKEFYQMAGDDLGLVRMALHEKDIDTAVTLAEQSSNSAVASCVAMHFEGEGEIQQALSLYAGSCMYSHAIRLAKEQELSSDLVQVAIASSSQQQIMECARWLEDRGDVGKAALLHAEGGNKAKALQLCLRTDNNDGPSPELCKLFASMVVDIDTGALSEKDVATYAHRFITLGEGDKAFDFLCKARGDREDLFESFASLCQENGRYRLASKFYAKAGDKLASLRCLVRTKETKTIIAFAKAARIKEAYEIAAEYIQTLDGWSHNEQYANIVVQFLSKAKSYEELVRVYEAWAHLCIEESEDYDKALELFTQGATYAEKIDDIHQRATLRRHFERQLYSITRFLKAKKVIEDDPGPMEKFCADLVGPASIKGNAVRVEHGVKQLVLQFAAAHRYHDAHDLIQSMVNPTRFIHRTIMEQVWAAVGKDPRDIQYMIDEDDTSSTSDEDSLDDDTFVTQEERQVWSEVHLNS